MNREEPAKISSPGELVATVPNLLGFHPEHSLVVLGLHDLDLQCTFRVDLPDEAEHLDHLPILTSQARRNGCNAVVLIAYDGADIADACLRYTAMTFTGAGIQPVDLIRITAGRWFSPACAHGCCPPEGSPIPARGRAADELAMAAGPALPDRASVVRLLEPVAEEQRKAVAAAVEETARRWSELTDQDAKAKAMNALEAQRQAAEALPGPEEVAGLAVAVHRFDVRDFVLSLAMDKGSVARTDLWVWVVRHLEGAFAAPVATIAAYCAYMNGGGVLALECLDLALEAEPAYRFAQLLMTALQAGIPPSEIHHRITGH